jgi:hypothetical protein
MMNINRSILNEKSIHPSYIERRTLIRRINFQNISFAIALILSDIPMVKKCKAGTS